MYLMRTAKTTEFLKLQLSLDTLLVLVREIRDIFALAALHFLKIILSHIPLLQVTSYLFLVSLSPNATCVLLV